MNDQPPIVGEHALPNGRRYSILDTGAPYKPGEYPSGGLHIRLWFSEQSGWIHLDYAPDEAAARGFLKAAARLGPPPTPPGETLKA